MKFKESAHAHKWLDNLVGIEIGGSAHNPFGLKTKNVDYTDDMSTIFKRHEVAMCGEALPVDYVAPGDCLPFKDKHWQFVISSHVIEHIFDPIGALHEWRRVSKCYVYIIAPQHWALESDRGKGLTTYEELLARHTGEIPAPEQCTHEHYTRWNCTTFLNMCEKSGFKVLDWLNPDDKIGNGFTVVIDASV